MNNQVVLSKLKKYFTKTGKTFSDNGDNSLKLNWVFLSEEKGYYQYDISIVENSLEYEGSEVILSYDDVIFGVFPIVEKMFSDNIKKIAIAILDLLETKHIIFSDRIEKRNSFLEVLKNVMLPVESDTLLYCSLYRRRIETNSGALIIDLSANDKPNDFELYIDNLRMFESDILISILKMTKEKCKNVKCAFDVNGYINHNTEHSLNMSFTGPTEHMSEVETILRKLIVMGIIKNKPIR